MSEVTINLVFDKSDSRIGGFPHGVRVYEQQVKPFLDYSQTNVIVFPEQIIKVASSFTQGFFSEIVKKIGYEGIDKTIVIKGSSDKLVEDIKADLMS